MFSNILNECALVDADPDNHRIAQRHKTFEPTSMTGPSGPARVHLINVSATGALIHAAEPPEPGSPVIIDLGNSTTAEARVVWTKGPRFGVAFRNRLSTATVERVIKPSMAR